ncbi:TeaA receptor TeaR [Pleurostoma richardsiae]|uniref:TeaA receptor TeaR n=1 Tax=Pleurostoma richardsiae TaxID=41990 RepID=A0AA38VJ97_9PEZI|nr:TeaA receptor TeaR [Pleurostoma richardsiae]
MAAMSAAPTATTLTPPSSSHGNGYSWNISTGHSEHPAQDQNPSKFDNTNAFSKSPYSSQNGYPGAYSTSSWSGMDAPLKKQGATEPFPGSKDTSTYLGPAQQLERKPSSIREPVISTDAVSDLYGGGRNGQTGDIPHKRTKGAAYGGDDEDENSKWIHRDKLARIESQELQAAGIILPKARARSKPRRDPSQEKMNGHRKAPEGGEQLVSRSRKNSTIASEPKTPSADPVPVPSWDLRLPEEVEEEEERTYWVSPSNAPTRIPIAKTSPLPIPVEHIERDTPMLRRRDHSPGEDVNSISYPKTRARSSSAKESTSLPALSPAKRSATDLSPKKTTPVAAGRKTSAPAKANSAAGRPKTRNGPAKDSGSSSGGTRPSTRSGERELSRDLSPGAVSAKQPEGDPPWMVSAYRPDPRLPPDQQLLPTVARRLQQEKWEREGKFGNIYDREFRPLTDEGFMDPPPVAESSHAAENQESEKPDEWPLKAEAKSPSSLQPPGRANSYSTIPKIQDKPGMSPLASPRTPMQPSPVRVPEPQEDEKKGGCGCCVVM